MNNFSVGEKVILIDDLSGYDKRLIRGSKHKITAVGLTGIYLFGWSVRFNHFIKIDNKPLTIEEFLEDES